MARKLRRLGIPVAYFIGPSVWAWRTYRVRQIARDVARKISGHETESIFSRYNITDESDLADAARKLEIAAELQQGGAENNSSL